MFQAERGTLRELNIADCHSDTLTAKTVLNLAKIPNLEILHLMLDHFKYIELSLRFLGAKFTPSNSVRTLGIKLRPNYTPLLSIVIPSLSELERGGVNFVKAIFPEVNSFRLHDVTGDGGIDNQRTIFDDRIHVGSVKKCRNLKIVHEIFPNAKTLTIDIIMNPKLDESIQFENLQDLTVSKEMFAIEFQLIHDLLRFCPRLKKFKVEATSLHLYDESKFISLLRDTPHLRGLEHFSLSFRTSCKISMTFLTLLLETCPLLEHVGNLLTWEVGAADMNAVEKLGKVAMFASRHHWSLPWRAEDGSLHEVSNTPVAGPGDLFDNF